MNRAAATSTIDIRVLALPPKLKEPPTLSCLPGKVIDGLAGAPQKKQYEQTFGVLAAAEGHGRHYGYASNAAMPELAPQGEYDGDLKLTGHKRERNQRRKRAAQ